MIFSIFLINKLNFIYLFIYFLSFSEEAELLARALGCRLLRTSVKEDVNVAAVFRHLAARCLAELRDPLPEELPLVPAGAPPPLAAFSPSHRHSNTIVLRPPRHKPHKKKRVLRNACRILWSPVLTFSPLKSLPPFFLL